MLAAGLLSTLFEADKLPSFPFPEVRLLNHKDGQTACLLGSLDVEQQALKQLFWTVRTTCTYVCVCVYVCSMLESEC